MTTTDTTTPQESSFIAPENHNTSPRSPFLVSEGNQNDKMSPDTQTGKSATVVRKPGNKIPVLQLIKSPLLTQRFSQSQDRVSTATTVQDLKSPVASHTPSLPTKTPPQATTDVKSKQEDKSGKRRLDGTHSNGTPSSLINRGSPSRPVSATYNVSPVSTPYLQLQEKLRARTGGKLVSLAELRNARSAVCMYLDPFLPPLS